jgi:hypothetical protein
MGREAAWDVEGLPGAGVGKAGIVRFYWGNLRYMCVRLSNGLYTILSNQQKMDSLVTSFDKTRLNECTGRCVNTRNNLAFTRTELSCLDRYLLLDLDVLGTSPSSQPWCTGPGLTPRKSTSAWLTSESIFITLFVIFIPFTPINPLIKPNLREIRVSLGKDCRGHAWWP